MKKYILPILDILLLIGIIIIWTYIDKTFGYNLKTIIKIILGIILIGYIISIMVRDVKYQKMLVKINYSKNDIKKRLKKEEKRNVKD